MAIFAPGILPRFPRCFTAALALFNAAALITLPLALFAAPNPFDIVNLKGATDKANPVGYKIGEPIVFTLRTENLAEVSAP